MTTEYFPISIHDNFVHKKTRKPIRRVKDQKMVGCYPCDCGECDGLHTFEYYTYRFDKRVNPDNIEELKKTYFISLQE